MLHGESSAASVVEAPHQTRTYIFPSRSFGKMNVLHRLFQGKWFDKYTVTAWLHYDEGNNSAYYFTCKTAHEQNKLRTKI